MSKIGNGEFLNMEVIIANASYYKSIGLGEVESANIFKTSTTVFDEKGLFSTTIFGPVDSELRFKKNGFIWFRLPVMHPLIYKNLVACGSKYKDILSGNKNAVFNKETKDFDLDENGDTGYHFFIQHLDQLKIPRNESKQRNDRIDTIEAYGKKKDLIDSWLVIAAGLRDYTIDKAGRPSEDEVNTLYRKLLYYAQNIKSKQITPDIEYLYDGTRFNIQNLLLDIYEYFVSLLEGKGGYIQDTWSARTVDYGTRNVVSGLSSTITDIDAPKEARITANSVAIGLFQFYKSIGAIGINKFHNNFSFKVFEEDTRVCYGFNKETYKVEKFDVDEKTFTRFCTQEGFDSILNDFNSDDFKRREVELKNRYLVLKYEEGDKITFVYPLLGIPEHIDVKKLKPVTYMELFYVAVVDILNKHSSVVCRYPIANYGSVVPFKLYVKTTTEGKEKTLVVGYDEYKVYEYPVVDSEPFRTLSPHPTHLSAFTMDFDGDMGSNNTILTDEGLLEVEKILGGKEYYLGPNGGANFSIKTGILDSVLRELSK